MPFSESDIDLLAALAIGANLRRVARELGEPLSTMSRRLVALEDALGRPLFLRKGRSLVPTRDGELLVERAARAQLARDQMDEALREIEQGGVARLDVATSPLFAELVLPRAIAALVRRHPGLRVNVHLGHDVTALHEARLDVALRRGPLDDVSSVRARKLGRTTIVCVTSARARVDPGLPPEARLSAVPWIRVGARAEPIDLSWRGPRKRARARVAPAVTVDSQRAALALVREGRFAARLNAFLVRDELDAGALVELLPEARTKEDVFALYPERRVPDPRARELVAAVAEAAAAARIWDP